FANETIFLLRGDARAADALDAVGALFHHAAPAHGDIGIIHRLETGRLVIRVPKEIEAPHFVGAIIRAEPRADAAVVNLEVQPFVIVDGGFHRADQFARRVLALHAGDGHV